jgi:hypothetical protein
VCWTVYRAVAWQRVVQICAIFNAQTRFYQRSLISVNDEVRIDANCSILLWESTCDSWEGASCTENYSVGRCLKSWTARTNFLWGDSEQWALFKHVAQYFCALPSCYRFAVTNSMVLAGWSQATHSECCFGFSARYFRLACHLKPISWSFRMWTELARE